jgi:hypothetical protein
MITDLAIQVDEIEGEEADADLNVLDFNIFPLPLAEFLEWH